MIRHSADRQFDLPGGSVRLNGIADRKIRSVCEGTLKSIDMRALADYFRNRADNFATGEFWGKIMRAVCLLGSYTGDPELRRIADTACLDMLSIQREDGCISTCPDSVQPKGTHGSDMWERKYALMGLLSYYEWTGKREALDACVKLIQYTNRQIGNPPKTPITETGWAFGGIESSSILEPCMRVYHLTGNADALELGTYIVESGCCARENVFSAILAGKSPKDIGWNGVAKESIAKAYEMMSCFEGLCEYYRATKKQVYLDTVTAFVDKLTEEEITLLGSGGADAPYNLGPGTGEQWNRTRYEQTNPDIDLMMETCVTVYWMRLCHQLLRLTGDVKYADMIEVSLYNAIYGALRPDGRFFEYFPRFNGTRNPKVNYSFNINGFDLSCCTANGPTGLAMAAELAFCGTPDGLAVNLFENAECTYRLGGEGKVTLRMTSSYPRLGMAELTVTDIVGCADDFAIYLRVPGFSEDYRVIKNRDVAHCLTGVPGTYLKIGGDGSIRPSDTYLICFDIPVVCHPAPHGSNRAGDGYVAYTYGSVLLARDRRDGRDPNEPVKDTGIKTWAVSPSRYGGFLTMEVTTESETLHFIDYMSAGNDWNGTTFASWLPVLS